MDQSDTPRISRRAAVKWMLAASASMAFLRHSSWAEEASRAGKTPSHPEPMPPPSSRAATPPVGYGTDPDLVKTYAPGDFWPLTLDEHQRRTVSVLSDIIIPADSESPSASSVGVTDFIDEWISAPYPNQEQDRVAILAGITWLDTESRRRFGADFIGIEAPLRLEICDDICHVATAKEIFIEGARFFALLRDLTASGFYTTAEGMKDLKYVGNRPSATFDGPPEEALRQVGLI
jgi:hypothetical protein